MFLRFARDVFMTKIPVIFGIPNRILRDTAKELFNHLTRNGHYMGRTSQLTSRCCILYIYSTNISTEYLKYAA